MRNGNFLLFFFASLILAIAIFSFFSVAVQIEALSLIIIFLFLFSVLFLLIRRSIFLIFSLCCIGSFLGIWRLSSSLPDRELFFKIAPTILKDVPAWSCGETERRGTKRELAFCTEDFGTILAFPGAWPERKYGECFLISGRLEIPGEIEGFRYDRYLAGKRIYFLLNQPNIHSAAPVSCAYLPGFNSFKTKLFIFFATVRNAWRQRLEKFLPEPEAGLASALAFGYRKTLAAEQTVDFSRAGLTHLIAISGSHITLIMALIARALTILPLSKRKVVFFSSAFSLIYVIFSGAAPSAIRAGVMGLLSFFAFYYRREINPWRSLLYTAAIMLLVNPWLFRDDIGFQLSFVSVAAVLFVGEIFSNLSWWQESLLISLFCQLAVWPISSYYFGQVSLVAPLSNLLVAWVFAPLFISLALAIFLSVFSSSLGLLSFWPSYLISRYLIYIAKVCAGIPGAVVNCQLRGKTLLIYYIFLIFISCYYKNKKTPP